MACPVCGQRKLFRRWFTMVDNCPRCELKFERQPGHSLGSVAINTTLSFGVMFVVLTASLIATHPEFDVKLLLLINLPVGVFLPILLLPMSKTLWTAITLLARPPSDAEVRPEFAPSRDSN